VQKKIILQSKVSSSLRVCVCSEESTRSDDISVQKQKKSLRMKRKFLIFFLFLHSNFFSLSIIVYFSKLNHKTTTL
jgi:hypothetical protein